MRLQQSSAVADLPAFFTRFVVCLLALTLAGCVTREPSPQDVQAKRFETVAGKAVIYLYRDRLDFSDGPAAFTLDGQLQGTSFRGTYSRLEVPPGRHRLGGYAGDSGQFEFSVEAGQLYFIRHTLTPVGGFVVSFFQPVSAESGRQAVLRYELN